MSNQNAQALRDEIARLELTRSHAENCAAADLEDALYHDPNPAKQDGTYVAEEVSQKIVKLQQQLAQLGE